MTPLDAMTVSPRDKANAEQRRASDPAASAFVAASAGSGKTKLLTDRLLRLMLSGADPARIQCLTFTRAAAAEMTLRLQRELGRWVSLDDARLDAKLAALDVAPDDTLRRRARALFARVLDLPGGMRIGTIHAFCQSLLRRFPLEAQISPHFQLMDDDESQLALDAAREDMLAGAHGAPAEADLAALAGLTTATGFSALVAQLGSDAERLARALDLGEAGLAAAQRRLLGVTRPTEAALLADAVHWPHEAELCAAARIVGERASAATAARALRLLDWLGGPPASRVARWPGWREEFITDAGAPRADSIFVNKTLDAQHPDLKPLFCAERDRVVAVDDMCRALRVAEISAALLRLAAPVVGAYALRKDEAGLLDYDDLIGRTRRLLVDPGAAWVLYKLDGGLDHLLLDEVQDTSPGQWTIANALTDEFFAGAGARDVHRSVFAVGDRKQSIYSFQGADVDAFDQARAHMRQQVCDAGKEWRDGALGVSFRSTEPVLQVVDAVFSGPTAAEGVSEDTALIHVADRARQAGRVELWPLTPLPDTPEPAPGQVPTQNHGHKTAPQTLAESLADWIAAQIGGATMLQSKGRPLAAGDVLILLRRRNSFARALVRALKVRGVPVAGLDRLVLTEQPAVQDLMALADTLLLPEDDLSLACVLTSPLGGLSDDSLMQLAVGRRATLWDALRRRAGERADWGEAHRLIATLLARVDYVSPHALFAEALGPLGGRARLFARLGHDAADAIDELLNKALDFARLHPPSLQEFVHWLRQSSADVKREAEAAGNTVRIMTVHGAKGLQAPLVILPDTTAKPPGEGALLWAQERAFDRLVPLWSPRREFRCQALEALRAARATRRQAEENRLLYVALTRAEDRLVICGWQIAGTVPETSWYRLVEAGFDELLASTPLVTWEGEMRVVEAPQRDAPKRERPGEAAIDLVPPPAWAGAAPHWHAAPPPLEPARPEPLAPSRPEGAALGPMPHAASPLAARDVAGRRFERGRLVHALLQHLPDLAPDERAAAARRFLAGPGLALPDATLETILAETLAILDHPELGALFGPGSRAEVPLTGAVAGSVIGGLVDRMAVTPRGVLLADYKTNREPPADVTATPLLYLRQMAAYRAVLRGVFPGQAIRCALIWTQATRVSLLPDSLLDTHAPGALPPA
jgi:ATP-dependent helicase/nuclease subunit A